MRIQLSNEKIVEHENVSSCAAVHVRNELKRLAKNENPPKEKTVLWY